MGGVEGGARSTSPGAITMYPPRQEYEIGCSSAETRDMWPNDQKLRRHGFKIWSRKGSSEAMWIKGGVLFTESEALALADAEDKRLARTKTSGDTRVTKAN
jgi:hypothetical protein